MRSLHYVTFRFHHPSSYELHQTKYIKYMYVYMYLYIKLILIYFLILKIHLLTKFICSSKSIIIALSVFKSSSCSTCANSQLRTNKAMTILLILVWPQDEDRKRKGQCGARSSDSDTVSEVASGESLWTSLCLLYNRLPGWVAFRI